LTILPGFKYVFDSNAPYKEHPLLVGYLVWGT